MICFVPWLLATDTVKGRHLDYPSPGRTATAYRYAVKDFTQVL